MAGLEEARRALESLRKITGNNEESKKGRDGVIYTLTAKGKIYVGFEYDDNVVKQIKDLLVRARSYEELGYLYEASYEVLKNDSIDYEIVSMHDVKNKKILAELALKYMLSLGVKCVNIWNPVDILNGDKPRVITKRKNINEYIKSIEARKKEVEKVLLDEYIENGLSKTEGLEKVSETYKLIMSEIRKDKDNMYLEKIKH